MQGLVYVFIALSALGVAAAAYFGLTFTPIEAVVTAIAFGCVAIVLVERQVRRRAEQRLEKAVEDLSRLLSTDAQAGSVLSQRINALTELKAGPRLDAIEADLSVLGAVVKQVTETVAELDAAGERVAKIRLHLAANLAVLREATDWLLAQAPADPQAALAGAITAGLACFRRDLHP